MMWVIGRSSTLAILKVLFYVSLNILKGVAQAPLKCHKSHGSPQGNFPSHNGPTQGQLGLTRKKTKIPIK